MRLKIKDSFLLIFYSTKNACFFDFERLIKPSILTAHQAKYRHAYNNQFQWEYRCDTIVAPFEFCPLFFESLELYLFVDEYHPIQKYRITHPL